MPFPVTASARAAGRPRSASNSSAAFMMGMRHGRPRADASESMLSQDQKWSDVPVTPVLLFISAENWSLLNFRPLQFGETYVLWGKALGRLLRAEEKIPRDAILKLERLLALALPTA